MADDKIPFSKKGRRRLTTFVGQELLYDYTIGKLDHDRIEAVHEFVKSSKEAQADILKIKNAMKYLEIVAQTKVTDVVVEKVKVPSTYFHVLLQKFRFQDWPTGLKMSLEILVVAIGVVSISLVIPWHRVMEIQITGGKEVVLAEVAHEKASTSEIDAPGTAAEPTSKLVDNSQVFPDDGAEQAAKPKPVQVAVAQEAPAPLTKDLTILQPTETPKSVVKAQAVESVNEQTPENRQGFLYRGSIKVTNVPAVTAKFLEKISELGGRKAGEVELGWLRGKSTYFHMTMPEAKYQAFLNFSKSYGKFTVQKEKHDRIMPEGIIRIIFTIDEKK